MEETIDNKKRKAIFYIGNGFDIAAGLKTGYGDFIQSEIFNGELQKNKLLAFIAKKYQEANWSDIEYSLYKYSLNLVEEYGESNNIINEEFKNEYEFLCKTLQRYLLNITSGKLKLAFERLLDSWKEIFDIHRVCCFNYTPHTVSMGLLKDYTPLSRIHGSLVPRYQNMQDEIKISLGLDPCMKVIDKHDFLYKKNNSNTKSYGWIRYTSPEQKFLLRLDYKTIYNQDEAEFFVTYGTSFGETDDCYFRSLFETINNRKIVIYHFGCKDKAFILKRIIDITNNCFVPKNIIWIDSSEKCGYRNDLRQIISG